MTDPASPDDVHLVELLSSAGVPDAADRLAVSPAIGMIVGVSRVFRSLELGDTPPASVFRAAVNS